MSWFTPEPEAVHAANTAATEAMLGAVRGSWFTTAEPTPHSIAGALPEPPASVSDQAAASLRQSTGLLSETAAAVFAMLDVDGSGILTIAEISQKLGQDMRDHERLQNLFPDLMTGKPSDLFVVAHGDLSKPHLVAVGAEDWNTYWDMIGSDVALEKLTLLRQLVKQNREALKLKERMEPLMIGECADPEEARMRLDGLINFFLENAEGEYREASTRSDGSTAHSTDSAVVQCQDSHSE